MIHGSCLTALIAESNLPTNMLPARSMLTVGGIATTPAREISPHFSGNTIPSPPRQLSPWLPPTTTLPSNYVSATRALFDAGMADPRGCEYREIEVTTGNVWSGDGGAVSTHGWVLRSNYKQKFAVCWNGLIYPVVSAGTNANLKVDIANLVTNGAVTWYSVIPEGMSVSELSLLGIKGCLLLRLGESDLARQVWQAKVRRGKEYQTALWPRGQTNSHVGVEEIKLPEDDPYLVWATEWIWSLFDRALCAHMRADDGLALASARTLASAQKAVEAEAERRGFKPRNSFDSPRQHLLMPYLEFLEPFPALLADQERRALRPKRPMVVEVGITNYPVVADRITALIEDLDHVAVRQMGQPGGLGGYGGDRTVGALVNEGTTAIPPLLRCLETDASGRLNRSVSFGRDFHSGRYVHNISESVIEVLRQIMRASSFGSWATTNELANAGTNRNRITAVQIRAYWQKFGALPPEERWYQTFLDKNAGEASWNDAIANIVSDDHSRTNFRRPLRGESLRSKTNPSVTELLVDYATHQPNPVVDPVNYGSIDRFYLPKWIDTAMWLAKWDARASVPVLRARKTVLLKNWEDSLKVPVDPNMGQTIDTTVTILSENLLRVTLALIKANDDSALHEYMEWLSKMPAPRYAKWQREFHKGDLFQPMWRYPNHQAVKTTAAHILNPATSTLAPLLSLTNGEKSIVLQEAQTLLCRLQEFQPLLLGALTNRSTLGSAAVSAEGWATMRSTSQNSGFRGDKPDLSKCDPGQSVDYRICDYVASQLARWKGMPKIELYWRERFRDEAVVASCKRLQEIILTRAELELIPTPPDPFADPYAEKE